MNEDTNSIQALIATGASTATPRNPGGDRQPYAIVPDGFTMEPIPLTPLPPLPKHIRQRVQLDDAESFILYVKAFRTGTSRIFASAPRLEDVSGSNNGGASITALLDYHEGGTGQVPKRVAHTAKYPLPLAVEFCRWMSGDAEAIAQADFVRFIEANAADIVAPDSATLMELVLNFESTSSVKFQTKIDRKTGGRVLNYQEDVQAGAPGIGHITVPDALKLRLPVFEGGKVYEFTARLEYRPSAGQLRIAYHLQRPHVVFRTAFADVRKEIATALEMEILTGSTGEPLAGFEAEEE